MNEVLYSPIRYPGGKGRRAVPILLKYLPFDIKQLVSPFFGGGGLELYYASKGVAIRGYDIFYPLVCFWQVLLNDPYDIANQADIELLGLKPKHPDTYAIYDKMREEMQFLMNKKDDPKRTGILYYIMNRLAFSGKIFDGMSHSGRQFDAEAINRLRHFPNDIKVKVDDLTFEESIPKHKEEFMYLDPPYLLDRNELYGRRGSLHKGFAHEALFELLKDRKNWALSYNNCEEIKTMYKDFHMLELSWAHTIDTRTEKSTAGKELLIFSPDLTPRQACFF